MAACEEICRLCRDFKDWVPQNVDEGIDGAGRKTNYLSPSKLQTYWTHSRIETILGPHDKEVGINTIRFSFIQIISILAYIADDSHRWTEYLVSFYRADVDDNSLPLRTPELDTSQTHAALLRQVPTPFHDDPDSLAAWLKFSDHQWKFLPLLLKPSKGIIDRVHSPRTVDPRHIIPVTVESELSRRSGRRAKVVKVIPHEASGLPQEPIVLKEYDKGRDIDEFMGERHTYITIGNMKRTATIAVSEYFLGYHGCFIQGNRCVLLIEYANQGSLLDFFQENWYLPRTEKEAQDLWCDLSHLIKGLALLHNGGKNNSRIHQDIKPANIFVSKIGSNPARFSFKFGDFGMCSVTRIAEDGDTTGRDNGGTQMYSAPELCRIYQEVHMEGRVTWQADIWSFGCVLLECGVWMTLHERGRIEFREQRVEENRLLKRNSLGKAGYAGAFHNGERVLSTIQNKVNEIWFLDSPVARLAAHMMEFIQKEMLRTDVVERLTAQQLQARFQEAIDNPLYPLSPGISQQPSQISQNPMSPRRTSSILSYRTSVQSSGGTVRDGVAWTSQKSATWVPEPTTYHGSAVSQASLTQASPIRTSTIQYQEAPHPSASSSNQSRVSEPGQQLSNGSHSDAAGTSHAVPTPSINGNLCHTVMDVLEWIPKHKNGSARMLGWLEQPLIRLKGRDQCFIFDNSQSMRPHWPDVKRTADALTYVLKNVDPDGFEIHMTNSGKPISQKDRKKLFEEFGYFDQHSPRDDLGCCPMETVLSKILGKAVKKALAPTSMLSRVRSRDIQGVSIYIFTNGVWEDRRDRDVSYGEAGGVENAIKTAVGKLQTAGRMRTDLSIQFISFGDDPTGLSRMKWLDDDIKNITGGWDIVDTTPHTDDVVKMIIGAISGAVDG
ncbi:kinase-like domain-containing protein [Nemania abortiva]|nr:kinase-like domain-containing protein [Nemania abortiva]